MRNCSVSVLVLGLLISGILWYNTSTGLMHLPFYVIVLPFALSVLVWLGLAMLSGGIDLLGRLIRRFTHWIY